MAQDSELVELPAEWLRACPSTNSESAPAMYDIAHYYGHTDAVEYLLSTGAKGADGPSVKEQMLVIMLVLKKQNKAFE